MKYLFFLLALSSVIASCGDEAPGLSVDEYILTNNLITTELDEGVHIIIHNPGSGFKPNINSNFVISYEGKLTDGTVFGSNDNFEGTLSNTVKGWQIGVPELAIGGSCTLIIPSDAGYGDGETSGIPGKSTLIFDIELLDIIL